MRFSLVARMAAIENALVACMEPIDAYTNALENTTDKCLDRSLKSIHVPSQACTSPPLLAHSVVLKDASILGPSRKRKAEELSSGTEEMIVFGNHKTDRINHLLSPVKS